MKRKNAVILAGMTLAFVFLTGCGVRGSDYLAQSNNDSTANSSTSKTEEQLQNEINELQDEINALKQSQNTQNSGETSGQTSGEASGETSGQTSGQSAGTTTDNTQSSTQTTDNSQNAANFSTGRNSGVSTANVQISLEEAMRIALERVPGATEQNISIHLDF